VTFSPIKLAGWNVEDPLTSAEMNAFQARLLQAVDGVGGGSYTLGSTLTFGGALVRILAGLEIDGSTLVIDADAALQLDGDASLTGDFSVASGGRILVGSGGQLKINASGSFEVQNLGSATWFNGSELDVHSGVTVTLDSTAIDLGGVVDLSGTINATGVIDLESGGRLNVLSGAKILGSAGGEVQVFDAEDLTINSSSFVWRSTMTPTYYDPARWGPISAGTPTWCMINTAALGQLIIPIPVRPGDTITTARVTLKGGGASPTAHGSDAPSTPPRAELIAVSLTGAVTVIRTVDDMSGAGNGSAYDASHPITLGTGGLLPYLVGVDPVYLRIRNEGGAARQDNTTVVTAVDGTGVARSFRGQNEVL
jgi:hypothetical protein